MPKLSQETLANRDQCPFCPETFRGRAALSGHIQFKHPSEAKGQDNSSLDIVKQMALLKKVSVLLGFDEKETAQILDFRAQWVQIKGLLENTEFTVNKADLKTYLITAIAQTRANRRLLNDIKLEIGKPILKIVEDQSKIIENLGK